MALVVRQVDCPRLCTQQQGIGKILARRSLRALEHVLHHVGVRTQQPLGVARLQQLQLVQHRQRCRQMLMLRPLVHAVGGRRLHAGKHLCHRLVGHQHGLLDEAGRTRLLTHRNAHGLVVLVEHDASLARLEVDGAALAPYVAAQTRHLVEQANRLGHLYGHFRLAGKVALGNLAL